MDPEICRTGPHHVLHPHVIIEASVILPDKTDGWDSCRGTINQCSGQEAIRMIHELTVEIVRCDRDPPDPVILGNGSGADQIPNRRGANGLIVVNAVDPIELGNDEDVHSVPPDAHSVRGADRRIGPNNDTNLVGRGDYPRYPCVVA